MAHLMKKCHARRGHGTYRLSSGACPTCLDQRDAPREATGTPADAKFHRSIGSTQNREGWPR